MFNGETNINEQLVEEGHAHWYDGGKRKVQVKVHITVELDTVEPNDREVLDKLMEYFETRGEIVHDPRSKSEEESC